MTLNHDMDRHLLAAGRQGRGIVVDVDRASSVRRAKRHSWLVRASRRLLPAAALLIVVYYAAAVFDISGLGRMAEKLEIPRVLPEHLTMNNPRYTGYTKDGGEYEVTAATARQVLSAKVRGLIQLADVKGNLRAADKTVTKLTANRADYYSEHDKLVLAGNIRINSTNGGWARMVVADVGLKTGIIETKQPVTVGNAAGVIRSKGMTIRQKTKEITFAGEVKALLKPGAKTPAHGSAPQQAAAASLPSATSTGGDTIGRLFAAGDDGPITINADRLDIDDAKHVAVFTGGVVATRGTATLRAPELRIAYDGSPSGGLTGAAAPPTPADPAAAPRPKSSIRSIVASGPVSITDGPDIRMSGATALYDARANRATIDGGVTIFRAPDTRVSGRTAAFDTARDVAMIDDDVVIVSGADRRATGDYAEFDNTAKTALLTGRDVVLVQGQNMLKGRRLTVDQSSGRSSLTSPGEGGSAGRISARLVQGGDNTAAGKAKPKRAKADAEGGMVAMSSFRGEPGQPIAITADRLDMEEKAGVAVFRGNVDVAQGSTTIRANELHANFTGSASVTSSFAGDPLPAARPAAPAAPAQPAKLTRVQARGKVVVKSAGGQSASGDWADFNTEQNTVTLGGDVVLTQGRNVVKGTRLTVDLATGEAVIKSDNSAAPEAGAERPGGGWQAVRQPSRPSAVFFPQDAGGTTAPAPQPGAANRKPATGGGSQARSGQQPPAPN
ncbi:MAG: LPS export ABC transporter periplasmic protein LptC [Hyphomicrobiaceae bacterium]